VRVRYTLLTAAVMIFAVEAGPTLLAELVRIPRVPGVMDHGLGWSACPAST
jgi:hypothetical protein